MWLMSALTPAVLATSYRFSVWMRAESFSSSDSGCPMPPAAPVGSRRVSTRDQRQQQPQRTDDADFDAVRRLQACRAARQLRLLLQMVRGEGCKPRERRLPVEKKKRAPPAPATQRQKGRAALQAR